VLENSARTSPAPTVAGATGTETWTKSGADEALFTIDANTGAVTLPTQDWESPADATGDEIYEVAVQATDQDSIRACLLQP